MLCSPSHSWEGDGTVRDSVHSWSRLERGKCKSHCECLGPGSGFVIERERLKITAQAVSTTQDEKCFPLLHLMALRIVSQRDRRLHIGQDNGVEDPYSSQAKCSSITANDCDFHIGWHWVCGVCDWGMCVLDWPLHWGVFQSPLWYRLWNSNRTLLNLWESLSPENMDLWKTHWPTTTLCRHPRGKQLGIHSHFLEPSLSLTPSKQHRHGCCLSLCWGFLSPTDFCIAESMWTRKGCEIPSLPHTAFHSLGEQTLLTAHYWAL